MKIGILGSGAVGQFLSTAFLSEGHQVMLGTRNPFKPELVKWKRDNPSAEVGDFLTTAKFGELLVLATEGSVADKVIDLAGAQQFNDKVVIDTTNPIAKQPPTNGVLHYFTNLEESLMERLQKKLPKAKFVKAFSCVGHACMYKPDFAGETPTMFICGNDELAKQKVSQILTSFGWETADFGKVESARAIEPLCILWCIPGMLRNQWSHAFKLLKTW
jgi:predicted dinucleotide-binding enzyme